MDDLKKLIEGIEERNNREHDSMSKRLSYLTQELTKIKTSIVDLRSKIIVASGFSNMQKVLLGIAGAILLFLVGVIAKYSKLSYQDTREAFEFNKKTYNMMIEYREQLDSLVLYTTRQKQSVFYISDTLKGTIREINKFYVKEWLPASKAIYSNTRRIEKLENEFNNEIE